MEAELCIDIHPRAELQKPNFVKTLYLQREIAEAERRKDISPRAELQKWYMSVTCTIIQCFMHGS